MVLFAQTDYKRSRGEGFYRCESANTVGHGNIWITLGGIAFLWDSNPEKDNRPEPFAFPEMKAEMGIKNIMSVHLESRPLSYGWKFGWVALGSKFCILDNKDIRFHAIGVDLTYRQRVLSEFHTSIAGYQDSKGTGFIPEGFIVSGGNLSFKLMHDVDFLAKISNLPLKISTNIGVNIPLNREYMTYSQYLINFGVAYVGLGADVFIEYSLEAFCNNSKEPKLFDLGINKRWEVAWSENPMYLTIGGRIRYPNGLAFFGAVPLLLSHNVGSAMTLEDKIALSKSKNNPDGKYYDEFLRGITDPYDPWYTRWKIILQISYPIRYRQTSAEMKRSFLLLKNKKGKKRIDIDKRMGIGKETSDKKKEAADRKKRLEAIRKRQEEIENSK